MIKLKGMTWSHDRGVKPLIAASATFKQQHPDVEISWDARSLADFELFPLDQLASEYDFIMIDHPHIGVAYEQNLLLPLENLLPAEFIEDQKQNSVGQSFASYTWEGRQLALPADAAAQTAAYRKDLLDKYSLPLPTTWSDVLALIEALAAEGTDAPVIGVPFVPVHAYSSFYSLCSQISGEVVWSDGSDLDPAVGEQALKLLIQLLDKAHPESFDCDPINMLDKMGSSDEVAYIPLVYGYSNYAREGYLEHVATFSDMPSDTGKPSGSMIGGVGLSISSQCKHPEIAAKFVQMTVAAEFQKTQFFDDAGQPGHKAAWTAQHTNDNSNGFFINTLKTLELGSMRPRFNGYIEFQGHAGELIREFVKSKRSDYAAFVAELNQLIKKARAEVADAPAATIA
ncbi:ABC transporter substrate-binding protein [Aliagarivorans taiwanensis]|uniref:ABC transporter substrate-binding protein n=1 Tax=Aliagarivorans taiwanensis TaxID=561966 RepID=UPI0004180896|nr:ABC transporter substrate-binding protein [Aliagarivorans taiwanensis]